MSPITELQFISLTDAANVASVSSRSVRRAISRGELAAYKIGGCLRVRVEDVNVWLVARPLVTVQR